MINVDFFYTCEFFYTPTGEVFPVLPGDDVLPHELVLAPANDALVLLGLEVVLSIGAS